MTGNLRTVPGPRILRSPVAPASNKKGSPGLADRALPFGVI